MVESELLNLGRVIFVVTTECNFCCSNCNALMEYYTNPSTPEPDELIADVKSFLQCVSNVEELVLCGGETFLNRKLHTFLEYLFEGEYPDRIDKVSLMTNGTVIPNKQTLEILKKHNNKNYIFITNYTKKSKLVVEKLEEWDINYEIENPHPWRDLGDMKLHDRDENELKEMYDGCRYTNAYDATVLKGEFHICAISAHGKDVGLIPNYKSDYVNLRDESLDSKINQMNILKNRPHICCCYHCNIGLNIFIERSYDNDEEFCKN